MTPLELRAALDTLGLTQAAFADRAQSSTRAVERWVNGQRAIPGPVVALVQLMLDAAEKTEAPAE